MQEDKNLLKGINGGKCILIHQNLKYSGEKNLEKVIWVKDDWLHLKLNSLRKWMVQATVHKDPKGVKINNKISTILSQINDRGYLSVLCLWVAPMDI